MPLPSGVLQENMHVVCLDADGQLEEVDSRIVSLDGKDAVAFQAAHFRHTVFIIMVRVRQCGCEGRAGGICFTWEEGCLSRYWRLQYSSQVFPRRGTVLCGDGYVLLSEIDCGEVEEKTVEDWRQEIGVVITQ